MEANECNRRSQHASFIKWLVRSTLLLAFTLGYQLAFSFQHNSKADSLRAMLPLAFDTTAVNLLNELARQYWRIKPDTARHFAQYALDEARQIQYRKGEAEALRILGWSYNNQNNQERAKFYLERAIQIFEQIRYDPGLAAALNNLGVVNEYSGNYKEGLLAHQRALDIFLRLDDREAVGSVLNYIGIIYQSLGNYEKAIEYCLQGLRIRQEIKDHPGIAYSLVNMGNMYLATEQFQTARDYYLQSLAYAQERSLPSEIYSKWQLGKVYSQMGEYDSALYFIKQILDKNPTHHVALQILGEVHMAMGEFETSLQSLLKSLSLLEQDHQESLAFVQTLHLISRVYLAQEQYAKALTYAQRSLTVSQQTGTREETMAINQTLSEVYAGMQDYAQAFQHQQSYISLKDSITSEKYMQRLAVLEAELELSEKQAHIEALTQEQQLHQEELKRQANLRNFILVGLGLSLLLGFATFRNIKLKHKAEHLQKVRLESDLKLERLEKEQKEAAFQSRMAELEMTALRAQMNPHFIFNCLNSINRYILKNQAEEASDHLTKFSKLIRLILQNSQSKTVSLENELEALRLYLEMELSRFEGRFGYQIVTDPALEGKDLEVPPLIIQPYVENAIWHGLMPKEEKGHVRVELHLKKGMLYCQITDDGVGRDRAAALKSESNAKRKSLGMQITAQRLELINSLQEKPSTVEINDLVDSYGQSGGTRVLLKIPVAGAAQDN